RRRGYAAAGAGDQARRVGRALGASDRVALAADVSVDADVAAPRARRRRYDVTPPRAVPPPPPPARGGRVTGGALSQSRFPLPRARHAGYAWNPHHEPIAEPPNVALKRRWG